MAAAEADGASEHALQRFARELLRARHEDADPVAHDLLEHRAIGASLFVKHEKETVRDAGPPRDLGHLAPA